MLIYVVDIFSTTFHVRLDKNQGVFLDFWNYVAPQTVFLAVNNKLVSEVKHINQNG
jgi:hypothetical protein